VSFSEGVHLRRERDQKVPLVSSMVPNALG
jgi:hypothetical protein